MTRRLAREEGFFMGNSAGSAVAGLLQLKDQLKKDDVVVVIFHDHGSRYVGKMFNDDWVRDRGFFETDKMNALNLIKSHGNKKLITAQPQDNLCDVLDLMKQYNISQVPVVKEDQFVGSISDSELYSRLIDNPELKNGTVEAVMEAPYDFIDGNASLKEISEKVNKQNRAVLVKNTAGEAHIITIHDIVQALNQ